MDQYEGSYVVRTLSLFLTVSSFLRTPPSFSNDSTLSFVFAYLTLTSETPFCLSSSPFLFLFFFAFIFWPLLFLFPFPLRYFSRSFSLSFFLSLFLSLSLLLSYSLASRAWNARGRRWRRCGGSYTFLFYLLSPTILSTRREQKSTSRDRLPRLSLDPIEKERLTIRE